MKYSTGPGLSEHPVYIDVTNVKQTFDSLFICIEIK